MRGRRERLPGSGPDDIEEASMDAASSDTGGSGTAREGSVAVPTVSAVVPTRNRAKHAIPCASAILKNPDLLELIFVDQSDDKETEKALATIDDPRLRYVRSDERGVTNGRNLGLELAKGAIVAYTDDDCRPASDWVHSLARIFAQDPDAAVVCGRVRVPDEIKDLGFVTAFEPNERVWQHRFPPPDGDWGITANWAMRRSIVERIGPFDPFLGAGAPLRSGGEPDFLFRVLKAGLKVINASEVVVDHLHARAAGDESAKLLKNYAAGTGAAFVKYVRLGDPDGIAMYLRHLAGCGRLIFTNVVHLHRPVGIGYAMAFLSGSLASFSYGIDRTRQVYFRH
jgi:GT2 family glycosyltransferase